MEVENQLSEVKPKKRRRNFLMHTRPCRQCGLPLTTCSTVPVVHEACREEYYRTKSRVYSNTKGVNRPYVSARDHKRYFVNEKPCEACGYTKVTKERKFFHLEDTVVDGVNVPKVSQVQHVLCPNCVMLYRFGMMEALTWKPV